MACPAPAATAVLERCKLLEVRYILKQYQRQPQPRQAAAGSDAGESDNSDADNDAEDQDDDDEAFGGQHLWPHQRRQLRQQQQQCKRLSLRVVLQRLPAALPPDKHQQGSQPRASPAPPPPPAAAAVAAAAGGADAGAQENGTEGGEGDSWAQRGLDGAGTVVQQAYTCTLEYPAFYLGVSSSFAQQQQGQQCACVGLHVWRADAVHVLAGCCAGLSCQQYRRAVSPQNCAADRAVNTKQAGTEQASAGGLA